MDMDKRSENGAIIIEAAIALPMFMFAIISVLLMCHVAMAQARITAALHATAKEISQYSYVYDLTGLNEKQAELAKNGEKAGSQIDENLSEVNDLYSAFKGLAGSASAITSSAENTESFLYYVLNQGIDAAKGAITGELSRNLMIKHFGKNRAEADQYLKHLGVEKGVDGLHFNKSNIFESGQDKNITLVVYYDVTVLKLLNNDMTLHFELCAKTRAWVGADD